MRGGEEEDEEEDEESGGMAANKTRTPHRDVGKKTWNFRHMSACLPIYQKVTYESQVYTHSLRIEYVRRQPTAE